MASSIEQYYEEELRYLLEAGQEFARLHPERARLLNLSDPKGRDPHVERLLESFAFLAARIHQRLDDDFPELTHSMLSLVWPHYLKPVPSMCMLELVPREGMVKESQVIPRKSELDSDPVGKGRSCRFQTCFDVEIHPFTLSGAEVLTGATGGGILRLRFKIDKGADPSGIRPDKIRLHLHGEPAVTYALYKMLTTQVEQVVFSSGRTDEAKRIMLGSDVLEMTGYDEDQSLLPYSDRSFPGFRLLQEYFQFPEKFLFLDVKKTESLASLELSDGFAIDLHLSTVPPPGLRISRESFKLYCTPIVNLFRRDGEPIRLTHRKVEHRVIADFSRPDDFEIYSVDSVEGVTQRGRQRRVYRPFYSLSRSEREKRGSEPIMYYHVVTRPSPFRAGWESYIVFVSEQEQGEFPENESISMELTCTNGPLAKEVGPEQVRHAVRGIPEFVKPRNITRPTAPVWPPLGKGTEWRFIAHLSFNLLSVTDIDSLRGILELHDIGEVEANRRRISGLREVSVHSADTLVHGVPVRGVRLSVKLDEDHFADEGDVHLFSSVLGEFLRLHASINSFVQLEVECLQSGEIIRCPAMTGTQTAL